MAMCNGSPNKSSPKCEPITIPMCHDVPYNYTRMPNMMGHQDQAAAAIEVHEFKPLVEMGCSKYLKFFLCSIYAPMCAEQVDLPIPACQTLCLEVKNRCAPVLKSLNFPWPEALQCDNLPRPENGLCMEHPDIEEDMKMEKGRENVAMLPALSSPHINEDQQRDLKEQTIIGTAVESCPQHFAYTGNFYSDDVCSPLCHSPAWYSEDQLRIVEVLIAVGSAIAFVFGLISMVILIRQIGQNQTLLMISICQLMVMLSMVIRAASGRELSSCETSQLGELVLVTHGQHNTLCNSTSLLGYVGWTASLCWWLWGIFCWWRSLAGFGMHMSSLVHGTIWGVTIVASLLVYTTMGVKANPLTGICNMNEDLMSWILPSGVLLFIGLTILILGYLLHRAGSQKTVEGYMGVYSLLFLAPSLALFIIHIMRFFSHQQHNLNSHIPPTSSLEILYAELFLTFTLTLVTPVWIFVLQSMEQFRRFKRSKNEIQHHTPSIKVENIYQDSPLGFTINTLTTNCSSVNK